MGASLVLLDLNEAGLASIKEDIGDESIVTIALNLTDYDSLCNAIGQLPKLDGVFSNAGIVLSLMAKFSKKEDMEKIFNVNTFSHINLIQQLISQKKLNKGASIVFTSSMSGVYAGLVGGSLYGSTKGAIAGYSKALAIELAPRGIRVNTIHPGMIEEAPALEELMRCHGEGVSHACNSAECICARAKMGEFAEPVK